MQFFMEFDPKNHKFIATIMQSGIHEDQRPKAHKEGNCVMHIAESDYRFLQYCQGDFAKVALTMKFLRQFIR